MYGKAIWLKNNKIISIVDELHQKRFEHTGRRATKPIKTDKLRCGEEFEFCSFTLAPGCDRLKQKDKIKYDIIVNDEMVDHQNRASRFGKYETVDTVESMLKGELIELNTNKTPKTDGIRVEDAVMAADRMTKAQKELFVNAKKGDTIIFNPQKAFNNEVEISSLMKISKEEAKELKSNFSFTIQNITRYVESAIDQSLFDKVLGEGKVTTKAEFRAKVAEGIKESYVSDSEYKFALDAKEVILKKMKDVEFPEAFLKRWVLSTNDNLTPETLDKEFPIMLDDLKWYLVKNKLSKQYECKVEKDDINAYAKKIAKMQFAQYGMNNVPYDILENYAQESLKKEDAVKNMIERIIEEKVLDKVKESIKLETKEISYQDFNKMFEEK